MVGVEDGIAEYRPEIRGLQYKDVLRYIGAFEELSHRLLRHVTESESFLFDLLEKKPLVNIKVANFSLVKKSNSGATRHCLCTFIKLLIKKSARLSHDNVTSLRLSFIRSLSYP